MVNLAARTLQAQDPGAYALLAGHDALFQWVGKAGALAARAPVLTCNALGDCIGVKFNHRSFVGVVAPDAIAARWRLAYRQFASLINDAKHSFRFHMAPGDVVVMDNERVLHGRDAFNATTSDRWLQGAYADRHELLSRLQTLHDAAVQGRIDDVEGLFSSPAAGLAYGEHLSLRDHMLQTAAILHPARRHRLPGSRRPAARYRLAHARRATRGGRRRSSARPVRAPGQRARPTACRRQTLAGDHG